MQNLVINHHIYLTHEQRYKLHEGLDMTVIGVSIPVYYYLNEKREISTSEPASEVFCRYYLRNHKLNKVIQILDDGYELSIPYREAEIKPMSNETYRFIEQHLPQQLELYYKNFKGEVSSLCLLDEKDGGSQRLFYKEQDLMQLRGETYNIMHFVLLESMEALTDSMY